jgi:exodeoxyribonuclease V alpha subunit
MTIGSPAFTLQLLVSSLESYLLDTRQIDALAVRQARVLSGSEELRVVMLLCLAALHKGAPRADAAFLMKPFTSDTIATILRDQDPAPAWATTLTDPAIISELATLLANCIDNPGRYGPIAGLPPLHTTPVPLLIADPQSRLIGFSRYWVAVASLEAKLHALLIHERQEPPQTGRDADVKQVLGEIFGCASILAPGRNFHYRQAAAAALALRTRLLIVSGGPGTGKTSVVIQILRALLRFFAPAITPDRIVLCAPTGRAKARMGESVDEGIRAMELRSDGIAASELDRGLKNLERKTLHGLLGVRPDGTTKYNAHNPLPHQVIVVDEASMVDLHLFAALMDAAAPGCRIILLGDMHQLPSVEAGAVLGDLTARFLAYDGFPSLTNSTAEWVDALLAGVDIDQSTGALNASLALPSSAAVAQAGLLADHTVILTHSYRSAGAQGILKLCELVNRAKSDEVMELIAHNSYPDSIGLDAGDTARAVRQWLESNYLGAHLGPLQALDNLPIQALRDPAHPDHTSTHAKLDAAFTILSGSRILVLGHVGDAGRLAINQQADHLLRPILGKGGFSRFFPGQQVILHENHHDLDLYNGDLGIVVQSAHEGLKVVFRRGSQYSIHAVERLSGLEPAYAMTVHKSQGSEFDRVLLALPPYESPLLSRQIIYTGITRARSYVLILGTEAILRKAIGIQEERPGGVALKACE